MEKDNVERKACGILDPTGHAKCPLHNQTNSTCKECMLFTITKVFRDMSNHLEKEN